jgi:hypothetical protein
MDPRTERLLRTDIRLRLAPIFIAFWLLIGSIVGIGLLGGLGLLIHFAKSHGF